MRHLPLRELGYAIVFVVVLAAIYVGAFYALLVIDDPYPIDIGRTPNNELLFVVRVKYRLGGDFAEQLFHPLLIADSHFRYPDRSGPYGVEKIVCAAPGDLEALLERFPYTY